MWFKETNNSLRLSMEDKVARPLPISLRYSLSFLPHLFSSSLRVSFSSFIDTVDIHHCVSFKVYNMMV